MDIPITQDNYKLVDLERLIEILFNEKSAPSKRFLMQQKAQGNLPHLKIGRRVFYEPTTVINHIISKQKEVACG